MTEPPHADRGSIVTYLDASDNDRGWFCRAMVTGSRVIDPETDGHWLPIVRPDGQPTLLDPALIVTTEPGRTDRDATPPPALDVLAGALAVLASDLADLDEQDPTSPQVALHLLTRFAEVITPIEFGLRDVVEADPSSGLATVLSCISTAAEEIEHGRVAGGKAGILIANHAMADLVEPELDEGWDDDAP